MEGWFVTDKFESGKTIHQLSSIRFRILCDPLTKLAGQKFTEKYAEDTCMLKN
jgi:hypothetical protein